MPPLLSVGLGMLIGLCYGGAAILVAAIALRQDTQTFFLVYFGGMAVRMLLALIAVAVTVVWLDADLVSFLGSLLGTLALAIAAEIVWVVRRRS